MDRCYEVLICPVCGGRLGREGGALVCAAGHRYDIARQGYVNLLGGAARSATLGDSAAMLRARRAFLDRGHYALLIAAVAAMAAASKQWATGQPNTASGFVPPVRGPGASAVTGENQHAGRHGPMSSASRCPLPAAGSPLPAPRLLIDAGCGEGAYLAAVAERLGAGWCAVGIDVAKEAARLAAGRHGAALFVVADTWQRLPLADGAVDLLLNVFAPRNGPEFGRLVRPAGRLLVAVPRPDHLAALRGHIPLLGIEPDKPASITGKLAAWFTLERRQSVTWPLRLSGNDLALLAAMTPGSRHASADTLPAQSQDPVQATAAVDLMLYRRSERPTGGEEDRI